MFDHLAIEEVARPADPLMDAPMGELAEPTTQPEVPAKADETVTPETPKTEAEKTAEAAAPQAWKPTQEQTKHFKRPEDLEVAYVQSSKEARRLVGEVKARDASIEKANAQVRELTEQLSLGPELKELTEAEAANMTPQQVAQHEARRLDQARTKKDLEQRRAAD